ncbi:MAG: hypothetical protein M1449_07035 [Candidatus Thermoplasmatota archaeon]|nr:hypothetical protein [Candidatus Thermoplasmatota archaeon]
MGMWTYIKRGFGYGLGGSIGWNLGNLIWRWIARLVGLVGLALGATLGLPMMEDSVKSYNDYAKAHPIEKRQSEQERKEVTLEKRH